MTALSIMMFNENGNAEAQTKTNLAILQQLYSDLFDEAFSSLPDDSLCAIERSTAPVDYTWLIENRLYLSLKKGGVRHIYAANSVDSTMRVLYRPVSQAISYEHIGKKKLERKISVELFCQVTDSQNVMRYSGLLQRTYIDSVAGPARNLENARFSFTTGQQKKSFLAAFFEPVLIIGTTGVVIFLFYSYRSQ